MTKLIKFIVRDERGVSAMEYAIMAGLVAVSLAAVSVTFKADIAALFSNMWTNVNGAAAGTGS